MELVLELRPASQPVEAHPAESELLSPAVQLPGSPKVEFDPVRAHSRISMLSALERAALREQPEQGAGPTPRTRDH